MFGRPGGGPTVIINRYKEYYLHGILSCNSAVCTIWTTSKATNVLLQINNNILIESELLVNNIGLCKEGKVVMYGLDANYKMISASNVCFGLLSCNELICSIGEIKDAKFVVIMPLSG